MLFPNYNKADVRKALTTVFPSSEFEFISTYGNAVELIGKHTETRLWIRLIVSDTPNKILVDFSNINLDPSIRRKGMFSRAVHAVLDLDCVDEVLVSSVLTEVMHKACQSLRMVYDENISGYRLDKENH